MLAEIKIWLWLLAFLVVSSNMQLHVQAVPQVPCFFIFGDSLVDNGNNNGLPTKAVSNYPPYGIDLPQGPTGRFSNGLNTVDILAQILGFDKYIPPFANLASSDIFSGVNYASAAAGIREESGSHLGVRISLDKQLVNHGITFSLITKSLGSKDSATQHLNKCLYYVGMGSNDYLNNYYMPQNYTTSQNYTSEQYAEALITQYGNQIKILHSYGARKVAIFGVGPIGCTPFAITSQGTNGSLCVDKFNLDAQLFNKKLVSLVDQLNKELTDAKFIYVDSFGIGSGDPSLAGFKVANVGCCPVNEIGQCICSKTPCQNRSEYTFWDSFHPTEAANKIYAARSYQNFLKTDTYPMDISHLIKL
ncbi:GDSL esterase/lipase At1g29670 [Quercus suber]|uniref:Gdsl esterase/lipase n=1 Tax=Quercus suber TaxID=58331 RepID=A0AAW0L9W8_QUESU|nr:GDSL esterase/lipase At1g29670-like [Quercus suber]POF27093.1 gdsl esterase/lipase [Quercus suber]